MPKQLIKHSNQSITKKPIQPPNPLPKSIKPIPKHVKQNQIPTTNKHQKTQTNSKNQNQIQTSK